MNKRRLNLAITAVELLVVWTSFGAICRPADAVSPTANRHWSKAMAVRRAADFCNSIGVKPAGNPTALFPCPNPFPDEQDLYWGKTWQLKFPDGTEIHVADGSGIVTDYTNLEHFDPMIHTSSQAISKRSALAIAEKVRKASGQLTELDIPTASLQDIGSPGDQWSVTWARIANGDKYEDQDAEVTMGGTTGIIEYYVLRFRSRPPASVTATITKAKAEKTAVLCLTTHGVKGAALHKTDRQVVQPNRRWKPEHANDPDAETPTGSPARHAWVCSFVADDERSPRFYKVFVDVRTGKVIGGRLMTLR